MQSEGSEGESSQAECAWRIRDRTSVHKFIYGRTASGPLLQAFSHCKFPSRLVSLPCDLYARLLLIIITVTRGDCVNSPPRSYYNVSPFHKELYRCFLPIFAFEALPKLLSFLPPII